VETSGTFELRSQRRFRKIALCFRCRHMITVYAVQYLAPDVVHFLSQGGGGYLAEVTTWRCGMILVVSGNALIF
jgi:hypothetical protein